MYAINICWNWQVSQQIFAEIITIIQNLYWEETVCIWIEKKFSKYTNNIKRTMFHRNYSSNTVLDSQRIRNPTRIHYWLPLLFLKFRDRHLIPRPYFCFIKYGKIQRGSEHGPFFKIQYLKKILSLQILVNLP